MSEPYIHADAVWKKFHRGEHHDTLRDLLLSLVRPRRRGVSREMDSDEFWAVRDVSFHVRPGETLGIIGGNGAGKSTLLKLLTRIFRPNRGAIRVEGRIGALIEVSAGFHPDLTGRENVYLQGSLMGMRRVLIDKHFDEIVEFSGVAEFLDTPVKRYSSGMNARLGFSIAAHLDPDVLIIDEVLAVGDFRFQQRAFDRLQLLAKSGRPVVVVSHQLDRIATLCSKAVLLVSGRVHTAGTPAECIESYIGLAAATGSADAPVTFQLPSITPGRSVGVGDEFTFSVPLTCKAPGIGLGIRVRSMSDNQVMFGTKYGTTTAAALESWRIYPHGHTACACDARPVRRRRVRLRRPAHGAVVFLGAGIPRGHGRQAIRDRPRASRRPTRDRRRAHHRRSTSACGIGRLKHR